MMTGNDDEEEGIFVNNNNDEGISNHDDTNISNNEPLTASSNSPTSELTRAKSSHRSYSYWDTIRQFSIFKSTTIEANDVTNNKQQGQKSLLPFHVKNVLCNSLSRKQKPSNDIISHDHDHDNYMDIFRKKRYDELRNMLPSRLELKADLGILSSIIDDTVTDSQIETLLSNMNNSGQVSLSPNHKATSSQDYNTDSHHPKDDDDNKETNLMNQPLSDLDIRLRLLWNQLTGEIDPEYTTAIDIISDPLVPIIHKSASQSKPISSSDHNHSTSSMNQISNDLDDENDDDYDPFSIPTLPYDDKDFIANLLNETPSKSLHQPERAWWMKEIIQDLGWFEEEVEEEDYHAFLDLQQSQQPQPQTSNTTSGNDCENKVNTDDNDFKVFEHDKENHDKTDQELVKEWSQDDWEEKLWEVARKHYEKAFPDIITTNTTVDPKSSSSDSLPYFDDVDLSSPISTKHKKSQIMLHNFRKLMEECLIMYSIIFNLPYTSSNNGEPDFRISDDLQQTSSEINNASKPDYETPNSTNTTTFLDVPSFVPLPVATGFVKTFVGHLLSDNDIHEFHRDLRRFLNEFIRDASGDTNDHVEHRTAVLCDVLVDAILDPTLYAFSRYQVYCTKGEDDNKRSKELNLRSTWNEDRRITRKRIRPETAIDKERKEREEFLYGFIPTSTEESNKDIPPDVMNKAANESEDTCRLWTDEEVHMNTLLVAYLLRSFSKKVAIGERVFILTFPNDLLPSFLSEYRAVAQAEEKTKDTLSLEPNAYSNYFVDWQRLHNPSLTELYTLKYLPIFRLRSYALYNKLICDGSIQKSNLDSTPSDITSIRQELFDSNFIRLRIHAFGAFLAINDHLNDFNSFSILAKTYDDDYSVKLLDENMAKTFQYDFIAKDPSTTDYFNVHGILCDSIEEIMTAVTQIRDKKDDKVSWKESQESQNLLRFLELNEMNRLSESSLRILFGYCFDIGRAYYHLGLHIGRIGFHLEGEKSAKIELQAYINSIKSYREALQSLDSGDFNSLSLVNDQGSNPIRDIKTSINLYLADCLGAIGYVRDAKLSEREEALACYKESLDIYRQHLGDSHFTVANSLQNLGAIYFEMENWNEAIQCYEGRLNILRKNRSMPEESAAISSGMHGNNHIRLNDVMKEEEIAQTMCSIAKVYVGANQYEKSLEYFQESIVIMKNICRTLIPLGGLKFTRRFFYLISEFLLDLSEMKFDHASTASFSWQISQLKMIFEKHDECSDQSHRLPSFPDLQRQSSLSILESLTFRLGEEKVIIPLLEPSSNYTILRSYDIGEIEQKLVSSKENSVLIRALTLRGRLNFRQCQYKEAVKAFREAWKRFLEVNGYSLEDQENTEFLETAKLDNDVIDSLNNQLVHENINSATSLLYLIGTASLRVYEYDRAIAAFSLGLKLIKLNIGNDSEILHIHCGRNSQYKRFHLLLAKLYTCIGYIYCEKNEYDLAVGHLRAALRLYDVQLTNPNESVNINHDVENDRRLDDDAESYYTNIATITTENSAEVIYLKIAIGTLLHLLGQVYEKCGDKSSKALTCYEDAILVLDDGLQNHFDDNIKIDAPKSSETHIQISSHAFRFTLADSYYLSGSIYFNRGQKEDAYLAFTKAIDLLEKSTFFPSLDYEFLCNPIPSSPKMDEYLKKLYKDALEVSESRYTFISDSTLAVTESDSNTYFIPNLYPEDILFRLGNIYAKQMKWSLGIECYQHSIEFTEKRLETRQHNIIGNMLHNMGKLYSEMHLRLCDSSGQAKKRALECFEESIRISVTLLGEDHISTAESIYESVKLLIFSSQMEYTESINIKDSYTHLNSRLTKCLSIYQILYGDLHPSTAAVEFATALLEYRSGDFNKSISSLTRVLNIQKVTMGHAHLDAVRTLVNIGIIYLKSDSSSNRHPNTTQVFIKQAFDSFKEAFYSIQEIEASMTSSTWYDDVVKENIHFEKAFILYHLGICHRLRDNGEKAMDVLNLAIATLSYVVKKSGKRWSFRIKTKFHPDLINRHVDLLSKIWFQVSLVYELCNDVVTASDCISKSLQVHTSLFEDSNFRACMSLYAGKLGMKSGYYDKALNYLSVCNSLVQFHSKSNSLQEFFIATMLGRAYALKCDHGSARMWFMKALDIVSDHDLLSSSSRGQLGILHQYIACLYAKEKKTNMAIKHVREAVLILQQIDEQSCTGHHFLTDDDPQTAIESYACSSENWILRSLDCHIKYHIISSGLQGVNRDSDEKLNTVHRLGNLYATLGNHDKALKIYVSLLDQRHVNKEDDSAIGDLFFNIGNVFLQMCDQSRALIFYEESYYLTRTLLEKESEELVDSFILLADLSYQLCKYSDALKWIEMGVNFGSKTDKNSSRRLFSMLRLKSMVQERKNESLKALDSLRSAIDIAQKIYGDISVEMGNAFELSGVLCKNIYDFPQALDYFSRCLFIRSKLSDDKIGISKCQSYLGAILAEGKYLSQSKFLYAEALSNQTFHLGCDHVDVAHTLSNIGRLLIKEKKFTVALKVYEEAKRIFALGAPSYDHEVASCSYQIGFIHSKELRMKDAIKFYDASIRIFESQDLTNSTVATVLHAAGQIKYDLHDFSSASEYFQKAVTINSSLYGQNVENTADSQTCLGDSLYMLHRYDESLPYLQSAYYTYNKISSEHHSNLFQTQFLIARGLAKLKKYENALNYLNDALSSIPKEGLKGRYTSVDAKILIGEIYTDLHQWSLALAYFHECLLPVDSETEKDSGSVSYISFQMSVCYFKLNEIDKALQSIEKAIETSVLIHSCESNEVALLLEQKGNICKQTNKWNESLKSYEKALSIKKRIFGIKHFDIFRLLHAIACIHAAQCQYTTALDHFSDAIQRGAIIYGETEVSPLFRVRIDFAVTLHSSGDTQQALGVLHELSLLQQKKGIISDKNTLFLTDVADLYRHIAKIYHEIGDDAKAHSALLIAHPLFDEYIENIRRSTIQDEFLSKAIEFYFLYIKILNTSSDKQAQIQSFHKLGDIFMKSSQYQTALIWYEKAYSHHQRNNTKFDLEFASNFHNMGNCYMHVGQVRNAIDFYEKSLEISHNILGENDVDACETRMSLAQAYEANSNFDKAIDLLQHSLQVKLKEYGNESIQVAIALKVLGQTLATSGRYDSALKLLLDSLSIQKRILHNKNTITNDTLLQIALVHKSKNRMEQALLLLKENLIGMQDDFRLYFEIGTIYDQRGDKNMAFHFLNKARDQIEFELNLNDLIQLKDKSIKLNLLQAVEEKCFAKNIPLLKLAGYVQLYGKLLNFFALNDEALVCQDVLLNLYEKCLDSTTVRMGEAYFDRGITHYHLGRYDDALFSIDKASTIFERVFGDKHEKVKETFLVLGKIHEKLGNINNSAHYFKELLYNKSLVPRGNLTMRESQMILVMGKMNHMKLRFHEALQFYDLHQLLTTKEINIDSNEIGDRLLSLGDLFLDIGNFKKALLSYQRALNILGTSESSLVCFALSSLGSLYFENDRLTDAHDCFKKCLDSIYRMNNSNNKSVLEAQTLMNIGATNFAFSKYEESKNNYFEALNLLADRSDLDFQADALTCSIAIATAALKQNKFEDALTYFKNSLMMNKSLGKTRDINTGKILFGIGSCLGKLGHHNEALDSLYHSLEIHSLNLGPRDVMVSETLFQISTILLHDGKVADALNNYDRAIEISMSNLGTKNVDVHRIYNSLKDYSNIVENVLGPEHIKYAQYLEKIGICEAALNMHSNAVATHKRAMAAFANIYGSFHITVANSLFNIGVSSRENDDLDEAIEFLNKSLNMTEKLMGQMNLNVADTKFHLALCFFKLKQYDNVILLGEECLAIMKRKEYQNHIEIARVSELIADAYNDRKEAFPYWTEALEVYRIHRNDDKTAEVLMKIASFYCETANYDQAISNYEESLEMKRIKLSDTCPSISEAYFALGIAHDLFGSKTRAIQCYDFCINMNQHLAYKAHAKKGWIFYKFDKLDDSLNCFQYALSSLMKLGEKDHDSTDQADIMLGIGVVEFRRGELNKAITNFENALSIHMSKDNPDQPSLSRTLHHMSVCLLQLERFDHAFNCITDAVEIRQELYGNKHIHTGDSLFVKGNILFNQGEYEQSLASLQLALFILNGKRGQEILLGNTLYLMGCIQFEFNNYDEASSFLNRSLQIRLNLYGDNHLDVAKNLRVLGNVFQCQKEFSNAESYLKRSIRINYTIIRSTNSEIADTLVDLAVVYDTQKKFNSALFCLNEAATIYNRHFEKYNRRLGKVYSLIGATYGSKNDFKTAIDYYEKSQTIYISASKKENKDDILFYASTLYKNAIANDRLGNLTSATLLYTETLNIYKSVLGLDNLLLADVYENLALLQGRQEQLDKACVLMEESLRIRLEILGRSHESIAKTLFGMGILLDKMRNYDIAIKAFEDCLDIQQNAVGRNSEEYSDTLVALGVCLGNRGEFENALSVWEEAYDVYVGALGYDLDNPKIHAIEAHREVTNRLLKKKNTKWGLFKF